MKVTNPKVTAVVQRKTINLAVLFLCPRQTSLSRHNLVCYHCCGNDGQFYAVLGVSK